MPTPSAAEPINLALSRTATLLFRPFNFSKWATLAFTGALLLIGQGGSTFINPFNLGSGSSRRGRTPSPGPTFPDLRTQFHAHLVLIILLATIAFLIACTVYLLIRWLRARAQFVFFENVVNNDTRIRHPWSAYRALGNSLFRMYLLWDLLRFNVFLLIAIIGGLLAWPDIRKALIDEQYTFTAWTLSAILVSVLLFLLSIIALAVASFLLEGLAVPTMYIRQLPAWPALRIAWNELFLPHIGASLLYFLFLWITGIARGMWAGIGLMLLVLVTCCTAACFFFIPFLASYPMAFICLPVLVFEHAYKLHFLSQFGPAYTVPWNTPPNPGFPVIMNPSDPSAPPSLP